MHGLFAWLIVTVATMGRPRAEEPQPPPTPPATAPAPPTGESPMRAAAMTPAQLSLKELTERGIGQFQSGQFDAAIESFSAAHVLSPNPMFLFNIAQAHRKAGRPREALTHYQLFLRKAPDSPLRPETEAYIALVQNQIQTQAPTAPAQPAGPPSASPAQNLQPLVSHGSKDPTVSPPRSTPFYKRGGFYGVLLGGAAGLALAIGVPLYLATRPPATTLGIVDPVF